MSLSNPLITVIKYFGFSDTEACVYLSMLELGTQPASVIAKKAGLKRGHTYNILETLRAKGVTQEFEKGGVKYFTCCTPSMLISLLERRNEELETRKRLLLQALPDLERLRNPAAVQPKVRFFQGIEGIKAIYEDTLNIKNQNLYALGDFDHYFPREKSPELNDWIWAYCKRRAKNNIWYVGIINKSPTSDIAFRTRKGEKRRLKMLKNVDLPVEINVYGNKVAVISSSKDMVGLIIEDRPIADMLRNLHQAIWKLLPNYR